MWVKIHVKSDRHYSRATYILPILICFFFLLVTFKNEVHRVVKCIVNDECYVDDIDERFDEADVISNLYQPSHGQQLINVFSHIHEEKNKLLIYSLARSGSSFLGEIFNRRDDVFYTYEPLHTLNSFMKAKMFEQAEYQQKVRDMLHDFFHCNFADNAAFLKFISYPELSNPHFRLMSNVMSSPPFCDYRVAANATEAEYRRYCNHLDPLLMEGYCKQKQHLVIKELVHRFPQNTLSGLPRLLQDETFRAIFLIRDPRAILWSMSNTGWIGQHDQAFAPTVSLAAEKVCRLFYDNYIMLSWILPRIRNNLVILRYEDLVSQPMSVVQKLFKFSRIKLDDNTLDWVVENTHGQLDSEDTQGSFSVFLRNSTYSLNSWRKFLPYHHIRHIQNTCGETMKEFGYVLYRSVDEVLNTTTTTFHNHPNMTLLLKVK